MKKFIAVLLIIFNILGFCNISYAAGRELASSNIRFSGSLSGTMYAELDYVNNTVSFKTPVLVVNCFKNGQLNGTWYKKASSAIAVGNKTSFILSFIPPSGTTEVKAIAFDEFKTLQEAAASAIYGKNSLSLYGLSVNGVELEEYSDDTDVYAVKVTGSDIKIIADPMDAGTKVEYTKPTEIPGDAIVKLTSPNGNTRNIKVIVVNEFTDLCSLEELSYTVDGVTNNVEGFNADINEYTVELPDNTYYVTVNATGRMGSNLTVKVKDIDHTGKMYDGVSYVPGKYSPYLNSRIAVDNIVPIKNEETLSVIEISYTFGDMTYTNAYNITFKSKQPRLTEFTVAGATEDDYAPVFISGAAVNNDNGTSAGADSDWSLGNVHKRLLGGSLIMMADSDGERGEWFKNNSSGEYVTFKANTSGTVYFMTSEEVKNADEFQNNNWRYVKCNIDSSFWIDYPVTHNGYPPVGTKAGLNVFTWITPEERTNEMALTEKGGKLTVTPYRHVYFKEFSQGELVSIYHPGSEQKNMLAIIVWD